MKILKIWDADYPWDVRVEKIATSLIQQGHEVHLVCRNKKMARTYENLNGLHIHRVHSITKFKKVNEILGFPAFFSPFWILAASHVVREIKADLVLVRDLPLCLTGWFVAKVHGIPVVFDMAEDYPEQLKNVWTLKGFKMRNLFIRNPFLAGIVEWISVKLVDHIIVVVDESKRRLVSAGVPDNKITTVINTPPLERADITNFSDVPKNFIKLNSSFILGYLGILNEDRGISTVIKAMPILKKLITDVRFLIIGRGAYEEELRALTHRLKVEDAVIFEGWIDYKLAPLYINSCDVGVVPHHAIPAWHATIPNKLFDYMQMGKPVIVSNARAAARIVQEEKCGEIFIDNNVGSFVSSIKKLIDPEIRKTYGANGKRAVKLKYNWSVDSKNLIKAMESVIS